MAPNLSASSPNGMGLAFKQSIYDLVVFTSRLQAQTGWDPSLNQDDVKLNRVTVVGFKPKRDGTPL